MAKKNSDKLDGDGAPRTPRRAKRAASSAPAASGVKRASPRTQAADMAKAAVPPPDPGPVTTVEPSNDDIARAAYDRYLSRGGGHGQDFDDWVAAERDLRSRR